MNAHNGDFALKFSHSGGFSNSHTVGHFQPGILFYFRKKLVWQEETFSDRVEFRRRRDACTTPHYQQKTSCCPRSILWSVGPPFCAVLLNMLNVPYGQLTLTTPTRLNSAVELSRFGVVGVNSNCDTTQLSWTSCFICCSAKRLC